MALARLAFQNLQKRVVSSPASCFLSRHADPSQKQNWSSELLRAFSSTSAEKSKGREIAVSEGGNKWKLFPRRRRSRSRRGLWRNDNRDFVPALWEFFPSGLGNALLQATENINRLLENLPSHELKGVRIKEQDDCYKLRYEVPGLSKEDLKITVEDGVLTIKGEHKEEEEEGSESDDEYLSSRRSYGYYNSSVILPDDAKVDEVSAEMKDGVLNITIPRTEKPKKDVKEIEVN
ncbi:26.5 kDa heat shock protein [Forsythia ovata]|uniref:26.5 kDa heat shock protein n=1 Tax=Forsythia ovata TaxID=205694 RepID=A0ABD1X2I7_9LAMI